MKARVLTALILIPVVLAVMMSANPAPILVLAALAAGISYHELALLGGRPGFLIPFFPVLALISAGAFGIFAPGPLSIGLLLVLSMAGVLSAPLWIQQKNRVLLELSSLWCICPLLAIAALHTLYAPPHSLWDVRTPVLLVLLPLWIGDSLAYFVGKAVGKHLLAPKISPKKTVEGAIANLAGCTLGAWGVGALLGVPAWISLVTGALAGVLGQVGDLFESSLKRTAGLKDTGALLPGHGGVLDRIDSLLLAAPFQALFLSLFWTSNIGR